MIFFILLAYTIPIDSPLMDHIEYLQLKGLAELPSLRPYDTEWMIGQIEEILISETKLNSVDRRIISYFLPLMTKSLNFSYLLHVIGEYQNEPQFYHGSIDERFGGSITKFVRLSHAMRIRRANTIDPFGPKPWNDFQVYLSEGLVGLDHEKIKFDVGRRNYLLGPGDRNSLLLSPDPGGYDGFLIQMPSRYIEFYGLFSILQSTQPKFLSVHRLGFNLKGFLKLGFTEAILSADSLEPLYLNVFFPFYLSQWGRDRDDNIMWSLDLQLHLFNSILYAELLIDDYMYEDDPYPDKLAFQIGLKSLLLQSIVAKINYTAVDKWVYTHHESQNVYARYDRCLGFPAGNDVDELTCQLKYVNGYGLFPHVSFAYMRKGEGSIFIPYEEEGGPINPPFPSGVVDKSVEVKIGADYNLFHHFYMMLEIGKSYRYNIDHVAGSDSDEFIFGLGVWAVL